MTHIFLIHFFMTHFIKLLFYFSYPRKIWNVIILFSSYWLSVLLKKNLHAGLPMALSIEPTSFCNLHCTECPTGNKTLTRPLGTMDLQLFKIIIDQTANQLVYLNLFLQGEPFLNKQLPDIIAYAYAKNIFTNISTNGHFLDDKTIEKLIDSKLDKIIISLDGVDRQTYSMYRNGGDFNKVVAGIERLVNQKQFRKSKTPLVVLQFLMFSFNEHQLDEIKQLASDLKVDKLEIKSAQIYNFETKEKLFPKNQKYARYKIQNKTVNIKSRLPNRCWRAWSSAVITWNGKMLPCCFDKNAEFILGDATSFKKNWTSKQNQNFRKQILSNRKQFEMCCNCSEL